MDSAPKFVDQEFKTVMYMPMFFFFQAKNYVMPNSKWSQSSYVNITNRHRLATIFLYSANLTAKRSECNPIYTGH